MKLIVDNDGEALAEKAWHECCAVIRQLLAKEQLISIAIPGGNSILPFFAQIKADPEQLTVEEWSRVHIWWTDERIVGVVDEQSSGARAHELFIDSLVAQRIIPAENIHTMDSAESSGEHEARRYTRELERVSGGKLHMIILGVGPDGHVASLFPGHQLLHEQQKAYLSLTDSPKPPPQRVTISPRHIADAQHVMLFFITEPRRLAYDAFRTKSATIDEMPCLLAWNAANVIVVTDLI